METLIVLLFMIGSSYYVGYNYGKDVSVDREVEARYKNCDVFVKEKKGSYHCFRKVKN